MQGRFFASLDDVIEHAKKKAEVARNRAAQLTLVLDRAEPAELKEYGGKFATLADRQAAYSLASGLEWVIEAAADIDPIKWHQVNSSVPPLGTCLHCGVVSPAFDGDSACQIEKVTSEPCLEDQTHAVVSVHDEVRVCKRHLTKAITEATGPVRVYPLDEWLEEVKKMQEDES